MLKRRREGESTAGRTWTGTDSFIVVLLVCRDGAKAWRRARQAAAGRRTRGWRARRGEARRGGRRGDASRAGGHVRSHQCRLEGPDELPLSSCLLAGRRPPAWARMFMGALKVLAWAILHPLSLQRTQISGTSSAAAPATFPQEPVFRPVVYRMFVATLRYPQQNRGHLWVGRGGGHSRSIRSQRRGLRTVGNTSQLVLHGSVSQLSASINLLTSGLNGRQTSQCARVDRYQLLIPSTHVMESSRFPPLRLQGSKGAPKRPSRPSVH